MPPGPKLIRLHRRKDIQKVIRYGRRVRGNDFDLTCLQEGQGAIRLAVVVPLMGNRAVDRNRLKRRIRAAVRQVDASRVPQGDCVLRARHGAYDLTFQEILFEVNQILTRPAGPD